MRTFLCVCLSGDGDGLAREAVLPIRPSVRAVLGTNEDAVLIGVFLRAKGGGGVGRRRRRENACRDCLRLCLNVGAVVGLQSQISRRTERVALHEVHRHAARLAREGGDAIAGKAHAARCRRCRGAQGRCTGSFRRARHGERKVSIRRERAALGTQGLRIVIMCISDEDVRGSAPEGCRNADDVHRAGRLIARCARDRMRPHLGI